MFIVVCQVSALRFILAGWVLKHQLLFDRERGAKAMSRTFSHTVFCGLAHSASMYNQLFKNRDENGLQVLLIFSSLVAG